MAIIPNISSDIAGPLGAIHLPRLWSKLRLSAAGELPADYPECGAGFDQMVLDGLSIDRDAAVAYVKDNKASYIEFENWVKAQRGGSMPQSEIDASNAAIRGYNHDDETRTDILGAAGLSDDGSILDAVNLNGPDPSRIAPAVERRILTDVHARTLYHRVFRVSRRHSA